MTEVVDILEVIGVLRFNTVNIRFRTREFYFFFINIFSYLPHFSALLSAFFLRGPVVVFVFDLGFFETFF